MFTNRNGDLRADAEAVAESIKELSHDEIAAHSDRKQILADALKSLDARLLELSEQERKATMSLLCSVETFHA